MSTSITFRFFLALRQKIRMMRGMRYDKLVPGKSAPHDVNALIEITKGEGTVKYEYDITTGFVVVDRIRHSSLLYPINYGCIPNTLSEDGDALDIIVLGDAVQTGAILPCRPVAVLMMEDEKGPDVKILAVPADRISPHYKHIQRLADVPENQIMLLEHFFKHYKDLESGPGKFSKTFGWQDVESANAYVIDAIERASHLKAAE